MNVYCEAAKEMGLRIFATVVFFGGFGLGVWCFINYTLYSVAAIVVLCFVGWFFSIVDEVKKDRARREFLSPKEVQK